jgi:hypothetical protein
MLSDGMNTQNRWSTSQFAIDTREQMTCDNAKATGVTLYMIQVNTCSDPTSTVTHNCASSADKFYLLTSAGEIVTAFNNIGRDLKKLRLAK